jgi:hypothetical protein
MLHEPFGVGEVLAPAGTLGGIALAIRSCFDEFDMMTCSPGATVVRILPDNRRTLDVVQGIEAISKIAVAAFAKTLSFARAVYQKLTWENLKKAVNTSVGNAAKLLWIAACILIAIYVARDLSSDLVAIEPISVPKTFSESGYTPEVAGRRLRDALNDYAIKANTWMQGPSVVPRDELPNIVVPKLDLSLVS